MSDVMAVYALKMHHANHKAPRSLRKWVRAKAQMLSAGGDFHAELAHKTTERSLAYMSFPR